MIEEKPIIELKNVSRYFGAIHALEKVNLKIFVGEVLAIVGDNGAGKSTLIKLISGVHSPTKGSIFFNGEKVNIGSPAIARQMGIETVFQHLAVAGNLDAADNIFLGREIVKRHLGFPYVDKKREIDESKHLLDRLGIQIQDMNSPVETLSGGQRQMVAIARTIYWKAKIVIMDEPTAALAVGERKHVLNFIKELPKQGVAVIIIIHDVPEAIDASNRIVVMRHGEIVGEGLTNQFDTNKIVKLIVGG